MLFVYLQDESSSDEELPEVSMPASDDSEAEERESVTHSEMDTDTVSEPCLEHQYH